MDFAKCFEILSARRHADLECPCCVLPAVVVSEEAPTEQSAELKDLSTTDLVDQLFALQNQRLEVYRFYEEQLTALLDARALKGYPQLCEKVTALFSAISSDILKIKAECDNRGQTSLATAVAQLQTAEKEKLTQTAARHLDRMRAELPAITSLAGEVVPAQREYLNEKLLAVIQDVNDALEEIQAIKADLE